MRRVVSWTLSCTAAAAILAVPAGVWGRQADTTASGGQTQPPAAQSSAPQQNSLAEAARKTREAKKDQPKATKVFDNDTLPGGSISTVGKSEEPKDDDAKAPGANASKSKTPADAEKTWRKKFADLRAKLARDQADLDVMQRELGVLNLQNYSDPNKGMQQELTRGDINKKTADIDAKQTEVQADRQAIDDAEGELRKSGGDSGWAR